MPEERRFGPPEARISCLPDRGSPEYSRLSAVRDRMYATLVAEYPSVRYWIVGYEASFPFFDCAGRQLTFDVLIPYAEDDLAAVQTPIAP